MRASPVVIAAFAACSGASPAPRVATTSTSGAPDAGVAPVVGYRLPAAEPAPAFAVECTDFGATPAKLDRRVYDLGTLALPSTPVAPEITERPRRRPVRSPLRVHGALARRGDAITACWKWAQVKGKLTATRIALSLRIDPWGRITELDAVEPRAEDAELIACIDDVVSTSVVDGVTTRWTRATATLELSVVDQPAWKKPPKRPAAPAAAPARSGELCTPVQTGVDDDAVAVVEPLAYSDHDPSREPPLKMRGRRGRRGGAFFYAKHDEAERAALQRGVASNLGGLARCHADARARDAGLAGTVTLRWQLGEDGIPADVDVAGAGDAALHGCLRDALVATWFAPDTRDTLVVVQHFALAPPPAIDAPDPHHAALRALAAHDPDAALARWEALLAATPDAPDACRWRAGVLNASLARAPWLDDARVRGALTDLVAHVRTLAPDDGLACLVHARPAIETLLGRAAGAQSAFAYLDVWRERLAIVDTLVVIAPLLDDSGQLELVHALGVGLGDPRRAIDLLRPLAERQNLAGELARDELARLQRR